MQTNAKQQESDPDFGEFGRNPLVGHEAGCERPDRHAREQVADQRWEAKRAGRCSANKCHDKADHQGG